MSGDATYNARLKLQEPIAFLETLVPIVDDSDLAKRIRSLRRRLDRIGAAPPLFLRLMSALRRPSRRPSVGEDLEHAMSQSLSTVGEALNAADSRNADNALITEATYLLADAFGEWSEMEATSRNLAGAIEEEPAADWSSLFIQRRQAKHALEASLKRLLDVADELARAPMSVKAAADRSRYVLAISIKATCEVYSVSEEFQGRKGLPG
jgi:hypothetical protein